MVATTTIMTLLYTAPLGRQQHRNGVDHKFDHHSVPLCSALHHNQHVLHVPNRQQRNGWCQAIVSAQEPAFDEPSTPPDTPAAVPDNDWVARDTLQLVEGNYEYVGMFNDDTAVIGAITPPVHHRASHTGGCCPTSWMKHLPIMTLSMPCVTQC